MAEVWLAVHQGTSTEVAIKVVSGDSTRHHRWLARFRNEIRAVAGLSHPGIVHVDDFGEIDPEAERLSRGRLRAGSPYLVMELVPGGSLKSLTGRFRWGRLRSVLLRLLDALAHAHARGLIHRDITPGNVLGDGRVVKLADFSLSHQVEASSSHRSEMGVSGTPAYMAPEQWEGRWRDYGPWTDLYGVGCLAWALATGVPPFRGLGDIADLREQHLWEKLPPLRARHTMPAGFEQWLRGLLAKDPSRRFRRAADAAWALLDLPEEIDRGNVPATFDDLATDPVIGTIGESYTTDPALGDGADAVPTDGALPPVTHFLETHWAVVLPAQRPSDLEETINTAEATLDGTTDDRRAPIPRSWRGPTDVAPSRLLPGAGLRLYGFRTVPVVGRDDEKNQLWEALVSVHEERRPRAVVLTGGAGCGKSRLARWLCERAHEVGAATILRASHGPIAGPTHGVGPAVRRFLHLDGLDREGTFARMRDVLRREGVNDLYEWAALTELVAPRQGPKSTAAATVRFADPGERFLILRRFLARLTDERPVVLWLDDAQWAAEDLRFIEHLLSGEGLPVLALLTVRDDVVSTRPLEFELLRGLETQEAATTLSIGPLPRSDWRDLVRRILVLEGDLAAQVEERTAGNPLFAVQLVADWVQRGILEPGPVGFRLRPGMHAPLPDNLHQVWLERMGRILDGLPNDDAIAVQIAAVLGQEVDDDEWEEACERAEVDPSPDLLERLQAERLAVRDRGGELGWAFAHGMLRETNERMAAEQGRLEDLHRICAEMLSDRHGPRTDERIGRHLLAATEYESALKPLLDGATNRREYGEFRHAELLLNERENALRALELGEQDVGWVEGWVLRATLEVERHRLDRAEVLASRAQQVAERQRLRALDGWASHVLGRIACLEGDLDRAFQHLGKAARLARQSSDRQLAAACHAGQGMAYLLESKLDDAAEFCRRARREYAATGQTLGAASMSLQLSSIALRAGRGSEAAKHIADALAGFESLGARNSVALCITQRGAIERARGEREAAERSLREALDLYRELGTDGYLVPLVQLAVVLLEQWEHREARRLLEDAIEALERVGGWSSLGALQILLLPAVALDRDWDEFDRLLPEADVLITSTGIVHEDIPAMARQAAEIARHADQRERAGRAYGLALAQYHALGDLQEVARTRAALHGLLAEQAQNGAR